MTPGSWPFMPGQCPECLYFQAATPVFVDDSGYEIRGFCRHPRVAMELFQPRNATSQAIAAHCSSARPAERTGAAERLPAAATWETAGTSARMFGDGVT